ncbi:MAG: DNA polymerase I, partial [Rhodothermales bacterium]|nr:DNA polymerase I [Rhodothermales bacterium]
EDLVANLPFIKRVVQAMDIPVIEVVGVEADDVIGTLATRAENDGARAVIVSPDKDFQQLLSDRVSMFRPAHRGESFDPITPESFRDKYGVEPEQFIDILALMGDSADNVPGVHGIGEKTAMKLIADYGTVENLIEHADDLKGKRAREGMQNESDKALLSKKLVRIKTDVEIEIDWHDLQRHRPDPGRIRMLFEELEFNRLFDRVKKITGDGLSEEAEAAAGTEEQANAGEQGTLFGPDAKLSAFDESEVDYRMVADVDDLRRTLDELASAERVAFDTETTSTDPMMASLVGISLSVEPGEAVYIPTPLPDGTSTEEVIEIVRPLLGGDQLKIAQNVKYDLNVLGRHGLEVGGPLFDTMIAHYLIAPEEPHGMNQLARSYLGYAPIPISDLIGSGKDQLSMRDIAPKDVAPYAAEDADITLRLADVFEPMLEESGVRSIAYDMEFPLARVLSRMERTGIKVDADVLNELSATISADIAELETTIHETAGEEFNIGSPAQIGVILFEKLGLPVVSKTSTGKPSTKESVLQELATEHELPAMILDWRELAKLRSTYVDALADLIHPETGRIHTSYSQTVAATGRLSSSNPNLQNIPIRTKRGREIRRAFVADEGCVLLSADYAQIELRILAALSGDKALIEAFRSGEDIHRSTAAHVFGLDRDEVTRDQRRKAKEVNYGIPYGVSAFGLSQRLRCPVSEAQDLIDRYKKSYPAVASYIVHQVERARENGYAETMLGRRRYIPDIRARNRNVRSFAERVAVNMPIQGTQADMIKLAMVAIDERLDREGLKSRMLLQVHDELVFEVTEDELDAVSRLAREEMISALELDVPVEVSMDSGRDWLEAH